MSHVLVFYIQKQLVFGVFFSLKSCFMEQFLFFLHFKTNINLDMRLHVNTPVFFCLKVQFIEFRLFIYLQTFNLILIMMLNQLCDHF